MSSLHTALAADRLTVDSPAWVLLRARNAASAVGMLGEHLGGETKRLLAPVLFERIDNDLELLRDNGFDLPRTAQGYCSDWVSDGILIRRAVEGTREETYELSDGALVAIRFVTQLVAPRASVTESRLTTILDRVHRLTVSTDPDASTRLAALRAERDRIDAEIDRVGAGEYEVLAADRAMEQTRDILGLADEIPADFARVRAEMERINRDLRTRLIEQAESRGTVLDDIFRGVDHLAQSDAGRSFNGFFSLILDAEQATAFEDDVTDLLARDFARALAPAQSRLLRRLLPSLQDSSSEIHEVMTTFSRSLRRFVQSQELAEDREIHRLLQDTQRQALDLARQVPPYARTNLELALTGVAFDSVSALTLHDPADHQTADDVATHVGAEVDWELLKQLARASEIDLSELRWYVNDAVHRRGAVTIAEVLDDHPATQGVASVVGLLVLADAHASPLEGQESVRWSATSGTARHGTIPRHLFKERLP